MKCNGNFGKLVDGGLVLAPHQIVTSTVAIPCPTVEAYAEYGFLPVVRTTDRVASEGHELVRVGWEERDGAIHAVYEERELPPRVVRWSKRRFVLALATRKLYTRFCEWADSVEAVPGSGLSLSKLLDNSTFIQSDDLNLAAVVGAAKELLGAETVDEILAESEDGE